MDSYRRLRTCVLVFALSAQPAVATVFQATPKAAPKHVDPNAPQISDFPFGNPDLPLDARVSDLLARLTTDEKISQVMMSSPAIPRLGIPAYHWWNEGLHGIARNGTATVFPQAIAMAATWDPDLVNREADVISTEARAKYEATVAVSGGDTKIYEGLTIWSPNINIFRDPRWGRGQETYGEDPFLTGRMAVAFVRGLQGNDPTYLKTIATLKHFAVHSGPEALRHKFDAVVSDRDLRETYLPAFEAGIREGGAMSVMSAYNAVDGVPAPGNAMLLTRILRGEWGFRGAVVGDVDNVYDAWSPDGHNYLPDPAAASAFAIKNGTDECSGNTYLALKDALALGTVTPADIDLALRRLLTLRFRLGLFDPKSRVPYRQITPADNDTPQHDALALQAATESLVLLKNDGTLPWNPTTLKSVAILGPTADEQVAILGNYNGSPSHPATLATVLRNKLEPLGVHVTCDAAVPLVTGFRQPGQPLPPDILFTDATRKKKGLKQETYLNRDFTGEPLDTGSSDQVDLFWVDDPGNACVDIATLPEVHIRWSGVIVPKETGEYDLGLTFEGAAQLYINGNSVAGDDRTRNIGEVYTRGKRLTLTANTPYALRIEYHKYRDNPHGRIRVGWERPTQLPDALAHAAAADHIILALGLTPDLEGEEMKVDAEGFQSGDRTSILLPKTQRDLLDHVAAFGKPFVVVLSTGSAVSFDAAKPNAILQSWYYGQRGGDALASALLGETSPSGRLPITFYKSDADLPPFEDYSMANRTYRYFTGPPLFPFGHGLSYTTFAYESVSLSSPTTSPGGTTKLTVTLHNTGPRDGDEVVQVYATESHPTAPTPRQQLVAFQRVSLKSGQTKTVDLEIPTQRLRRWDEQKNADAIPPGDYQLHIGPSSANTPLTVKLTIADASH
jgi:beta-glucosidase